jgi:toxin FitB
VKKYLLDTNIVSELRKPKPHGGVLAWIKELRDEQIYLSAVTFGELQRGVERTRERDRIKAEEIETWVERLAGSAQILAMDVACFREWARLMEGKQEHLLEDAMIAAAARTHGLVVATRNDRDFAQLDVSVVNPFTMKDGPA